VIPESPAPRPGRYLNREDARVARNFLLAMSDSAIHAVAGAAGGIVAMTAT
jgi:hypothetical protein